MCCWDISNKWMMRLILWIGPCLNLKNALPHIFLFTSCNKENSPALFTVITKSKLSYLKNALTVFAWTKSKAASKPWRRCKELPTSVATCSVCAAGSDGKEMTWKATPLSTYVCLYIYVYTIHTNMPYFMTTLIWLCIYLCNKSCRFYFKSTSINQSNTCILCTHADPDG